MRVSRFSLTSKQSWLELNSIFETNTTCGLFFFLEKHCLDILANTSSTCCDSWHCLQLGLQKTGKHKGGVGKTLEFLVWDSAETCCCMLITCGHSVTARPPTATEMMAVLRAKKPLLFHIQVIPRRDKWQSPITLRYLHFALFSNIF